MAGLSRKARDDSFIATRYDIDVAERFRVRAEKALAQVGQHPLLGPHPAWSTRHKRLRFWIVNKTNYVIYYEVVQDAVSIERVLDGRRDVHRIVELGIEDAPEEE